MMRLKEHLAKVLDYMEEDEREDFLAREPGEARGHIYPVIVSARATMLQESRTDVLKHCACLICDYLEPQEKQHMESGLVTVRAFHVMRHIFHVRRSLEREAQA